MIRSDRAESAVAAVLIRPNDDLSGGRCLFLRGQDLLQRDGDLV
jgi:hypothetical protein